MIRRIRDLLYDQGFTISGARNKMQEILQTEREQKNITPFILDETGALIAEDPEFPPENEPVVVALSDGDELSMIFIRRELFEIRDLLSPHS